jgi:hypothetical protein
MGYAIQFEASSLNTTMYMQHQHEKRLNSNCLYRTFEQNVT